MKLKRKKVTLREEQKIVTYMITSTEFLKQTKHMVKPFLLESTYGKVVAGWCLEYFEHTGKAPGRDIQDLYIKNRKHLEDEEEVELVAEFLQNLNDEWEESQINNVGYEVKNCKKYIKIQQLKQLVEQINMAISEGEEEQGESFVANYKKIGEHSAEGVDLLNDYKAVQQAFNESEEILFRLQGDLGKAVGNLCRGDFLGILGGPKSGKSFIQWMIGHRAALLGLKVCILNFEMSKNQYTRRAWQSLQGLPKETKKVKIPFFERDEDDKKLHYIRYREEKRKGINTQKIQDLQKKYRKALRGGQIKIESFTSGQSSFSEAVTRLENLEYYENFVPDVVIWDYPDIMKHEGRGDHRHLIDNTWKNIRGYSQEKNCLCVAASQVNASAWGKDIKGSDADENKKKANHITKMIAINSTEEEFDNGIVRIQSLYEREGKKVLQQVYVLQCLDIGRAYLDSKFRNYVEVEED